MKQRQKYFIFNKERDFSRSWADGVIRDGDGIRLSDSPNGAGRAVFITRILDSREKDMVWHRLLFHVEDRHNTPYTVTVYASNSLEFNGKRGLTDLAGLLTDPSVSTEEKLAETEPFAQKKVAGQQDVLLHEVTGRYLWLAFEIYRQGKGAVRISRIYVSFPGQTWLSYLPEVYQANDKNGFLERYLAVFQTLYEDLNREIGSFPLLLDVDTTTAEFLSWLAEWMDIAGSYMWSEKQLRSLLKHAVEFYRKRGTREGILDFIRLYTGSDAYLVEYHQLNAFMKDSGQKEILARLYGFNPYILTVLLKKEDVPTQEAYKALLRVMEEIMPAQMELNLVILEPYLFLGGHSYLGINSSLGEYRRFALDGLSMVPFSVIQDTPDA